MDGWVGDDAQMDRLAGDEGQMDEYISVVGGRVGGWMYIVDPAIPGASIDEEKGEFWVGGGFHLLEITTSLPTRGVKDLPPRGRFSPPHCTLRSKFLHNCVPLCLGLVF